MAIPMPASGAAFRAMKDSLEVALADDGDDANRLALCIIAVMGVPLPPRDRWAWVATRLNEQFTDNPLALFIQALNMVSHPPPPPSDASSDNWRDLA